MVLDVEGETGDASFDICVSHALQPLRALNTPRRNQNGGCVREEGGHKRTGGMRGTGSDRRSKSSHSTHHHFGVPLGNWTLQGLFLDGLGIPSGVNSNPDHPVEDQARLCYRVTRKNRRYVRTVVLGGPESEWRNQSCPNNESEQKANWKKSRVILENVRVSLALPTRGAAQYSMMVFADDL